MHTAEIPPKKAGKRKSRRKFSLRQKQRIIEDCSRPGMSIPQVAAIYKIEPYNIYRWKRIFDSAASGKVAKSTAIVRPIATAPLAEASHTIRALEAKVRELESAVRTARTDVLDSQRLIGKMALEIERLQSETVAERSGT